MKIIVIGAGITGTLTAYQLAQKGANVTLLEAAQPASKASGASFGWINASYFINEAHFKLRLAAFDAHKRLENSLRTKAINWQGCLWWALKPAEIDAQYTKLKSLGYNVRLTEGAQLKALEPQVALPERALLCPDEAAVDLTMLIQDALNALHQHGGRLISGITATGITERNGKIRGITWSGGEMCADRVVLATGTATEALLAPLGIYLPMLDRPGLILRSNPLPPMLSHILAVPSQELRQDKNGCLIAPTAAAHQSDATEAIEEDPSVLADKTMARIHSLLQREITWQQVTLAYRPVPEDGLPVIGHCGPEGLYVSTMHSAATLAPLVAEFSAAEILQENLSQAALDLINPYRPQRFQPC